MFELVLTILCGALMFVLMQNVRLQNQLKASQEEAKKVSVDLVKHECKNQNIETTLKELIKLKEDNKLTNNKIIFQECENNSLVDSANELIDEVNRLNKELEQEKMNNLAILSQKKSSEVRLGGIGESLVPFLEGFKYDPSHARFLGQPLDYIIFDIDSAEPAIVFMEVKTGNSQLSPTQRTIKNLVKKGAVRFEEFRISDKGIKVKITKNDED